MTTTPSSEVELLRQENVRLRARLQAIGGDTGAREPSELEKRLARLERLAHKAHTRLYYFDATYVCRYVNEAVERAWGIPRQEMLDRPLDDFAQAGFRHIFRPRLALVFQGQEQSFEYEDARPGRRLFHRVSMSPDWQQGQVVGAFLSAHEVTDLHTAQSQAVERSHLLRLAADNLPALIGYYDSQTVCRFANRHYATWYGIAPEHAVGMKLQDAVSAEVFRSVQNRVARVLSGETVQMEGLHHDPDGRQRYISGWYVPDIQNGETVGFFVSFNDISERKAAEDALRQHQQFMQSLMDNVPGLLGYYDRHLICQFANRQYEVLYGRPLSDIVGRHLSENVPADAWPDAQPHAQAAIRGEAQVFEASFMHLGFEKRFVMVNYIPDMRDGVVHGLFVRVDDITAEKQAQLQILELNHDLEARIRQRSVALYESEERYRMMAEGMQGSALYFLSPDGRISSWTRSAQRLTGFASKEVLGRHFSMFFAPADLNEKDCDQLLISARDAGQHELRAWWVCKNGTRFFAMVVINPLLNSHGQLRGYSQLVRDITDIRQAQDLMRNLHAELETRVQLRTAQLQQANRELEAFSYSVSHDLRSPLRHIVGHVEMLRMLKGESLDEETGKTLNTVGESAKRMGLLIDGLLAFARTGRAAIHPVSIQFNPMIDALREALSHQTAGRQIEWSIAPLPEVVGDPVLLQEVWSNLLDNAVKYTRPRTLAHITIDSQIDADGRIVFRVSDNGVGFEPRHADKLFGMFQRLHHADEFEGTGIGLALIERIVARHGGRVWAQSTPGAGSQFYFSLPAPSKTIATPH